MLKSLQGIKKAFAAIPVLEMTIAKVRVMYIKTFAAYNHGQITPLHTDRPSYNAVVQRDE
jgi:hypothetical protein